MSAPQHDNRSTNPESRGQDKPRAAADAELEREIRMGRQFSLADAIGRMAGPGAMKGVSPIPRKKQAELEIESFLRSQWSDGGSELGVALLRRVRDSELLLNNYDQPQVVLARFIQHVLETPYLMQELVSDADIEWGRVFGERPYFEREGSPPHKDDPYTLDSVRASLNELLAKLDTGK